MEAQTIEKTNANKFFGFRRIGRVKASRRNKEQQKIKDSEDGCGTEYDSIFCFYCS